MSDSVSIEIGAPTAHVWELVSDVTNYGKWSPENQDTTWIGDTRTPRVGARFKGRNRKWLYVWWTQAEVTECEPPRVFEFVTYVGGRRSTYWRYELSEIPGGTRVVESYEVVFSPFRSLYGVIRRRRDLKSGITKTLQRLKEAAESQER